MLWLRALLFAAGVVLVWWAYVILDNIWTYNDSGTTTYIAFALGPGLVGLLCVVLALRGVRRTR